DIRGQVDQAAPHGSGSFGDVTRACGVYLHHLSLATSTWINGGSVDNGVRGEGGNATQDIIALRQVERQRLSGSNLLGMGMMGGIVLKNVSGPDREMSSEVTTATSNEQSAFGCHHGCVHAGLQSSLPYLFVKTHSRRGIASRPCVESTLVQQSSPPACGMD